PRRFDFASNPRVMARVNPAHMILDDLIVPDAGVVLLLAVLVAAQACVARRISPGEGLWAHIFQPDFRCPILLPVAWDIEEGLIVEGISHKPEAKIVDERRLENGVQTSEEHHPRDPV